MGERKRRFFEPSFTRSIKVQGGDDRLTSDAGVLLLPEAEQRLGLTSSLAKQLHDPRQQHLVRYQMSELLRERLYSMAQGYRAQDDVDRLAHDPALRMATWDRRGEQVLDERSASQPTHSRLVDNSLIRRATWRPYEAPCVTGWSDTCERRAIMPCGGARSTSTASLWKFLASRPGRRTTAITRRGSTIPWRPVSRWRVATTVRAKAGDWGTASSTPSCGAATFTRPKGSCGFWTAFWNLLRS